MISEAQLLRGKPIHLKTVGTIVPPTLDKIFDSDNADEDPVENYLYYLAILQMTLDDFLDKAGLRDAFNSIPIAERISYNIYDFLILEEHTREILQKSLSFFIAEKIQFNQNTSAFDVISDDRAIGLINKDNFEQVRTHILRVNCITFKPSLAPKFTSKKAQMIYEKCQAGRKQMDAAKSKHGTSNDMKYSLTNLVRYVGTRSQSYNLLNIWGLTVYQFYEEFHSMNLYTQLDAYTSKWSFWGKDKFDFSEYYSNIEFLKT